MKVKFTSGPKQGTIEHLQPSIANVLIASGMAELVPFANYRERLASEEQQRQASLPAQPPAKVMWSLAKDVQTGRYYISAKCNLEVCSRMSCTTSPSKNLEELTFYHSCGGVPEKVPAQIAAKYRAQFAAPTSLSADDVGFARLASGAPQTKLDRECNEYVQKPEFVNDAPARDWSKV
jgi:hypothetical protein